MCRSGDSSEQEKQSTPSMFSIDVCWTWYKTISCCVLAMIRDGRTFLWIRQGGRPNPYLLRQTYQFFCFRWDENGEGVRLDINHPFIVLSFLIHIYCSSYGKFWPDKHWEPRQPTKGADWDCGFSESARAFCEGAIAWKVDDFSSKICCDDKSMKSVALLAQTWNAWYVWRSLALDS